MTSSCEIGINNTYSTDMIIQNHLSLVEYQNKWTALNGKFASLVIISYAIISTGVHIDGFVQDWSNFSELSMELLQFCTDSSIWRHFSACFNTQGSSFRYGTTLHPEKRTSCLYFSKNPKYWWQNFLTFLIVLKTRIKSLLDLSRLFAASLS